jgi:flagellin FlaB
MLKRREGMLSRLVRKLQRDERGITGLETAIILIAFVVVASVFAYTVLSAGIFSSQKGQEAVYTGLEQARSTLELKGDVVAIANANATAVTDLIFSLSNALDGEAIDLTDTTGNNVTVISYSSSGNRTEELNWASAPQGWGDDDKLLEAGEMFEITVDMTSAGESIGTYQTFALEVKPPTGSALIIERTTPAALDAVMILH